MRKLASEGGALDLSGFTTQELEAFQKGDYSKIPTDKLEKLMPQEPPSALEAAGQGLLRESIPVVGSYIPGQERGEAAAKAHPGAYHGAGVAGGIAASYLLPEVKILEALKGAGFLKYLARAGVAGATAAVEGGLSRPKGAENMTSEQNLAARAEAAKSGAMFGAGGEAILGPILSRYLGSGAEKRAEEAAYDVLGATKETSKHIAKGEKRAIGKTLLETGIVGGDLPSRTTVQERITNQIGNSEDAITDLLFQNKDKIGPSPTQLADTIEASLRRNATVAPGPLPPTIWDKLQGVRSMGASKQGFLPKTTPQELNLLRKNAQKNVDWERKNSGRFLRSEEDRLKEGFSAAQQGVARDALTNISPDIGDELNKMHRLIPANEMISDYLNPAKLGQWANKNKLLLGTGALGLSGTALNAMTSDDLGDTVGKAGLLTLGLGLLNKSRGPQARAAAFSLLKNVQAPSAMSVGNIMSGWATSPTEEAK